MIKLSIRMCHWCYPIRFFRSQIDWNLLPIQYSVFERHYWCVPYLWKVNSNKFTRLKPSQELVWNFYYRVQLCGFMSYLLRRHKGCWDTTKIGTSSANTERYECTDRRKWLRRMNSMWGILHVIWNIKTVLILKIFPYSSILQKYKSFNSWRVNFNVSDETSTSFNCELDYLKRERGWILWLIGKY